MLPDKILIQLLPASFAFSLSFSFQILLSPQALHIISPCLLACCLVNFTSLRRALLLHESPSWRPATRTCLGPTAPTRNLAPELLHPPPQQSTFYSLHSVLCFLSVPLFPAHPQPAIGSAASVALSLTSLLSPSAHTWDAQQVLMRKEAFTGLSTWPTVHSPWSTVMSVSDRPLSFRNTCTRNLVWWQSWLVPEHLWVTLGYDQDWAMAEMCEGGGNH